MTNNITKLKSIAVALAMVFGLSTTTTSAAYAEGWYAGIQQNSTSFAIQEENIREIKYEGLLNQTFLVGRDFDLGHVLRNLTFGIEGSIGWGKSSSDTGDKQHMDSIDNLSGATANLPNGIRVPIVTRLYNLSRAIDNELLFRAHAGYSLTDYLDNDAWVYGTLGFARINTEGIRSRANLNLSRSSTLDTNIEPLKDEAIYGLTYGIGGEIGIPGTLLNIRLEYSTGAYKRLSLGTVYQF